MGKITAEREVARQESIKASKFQQAALLRQMAAMKQTKMALENRNKMAAILKTKTVEATALHAAANDQMNKALNFGSHTNNLGVKHSSAPGTKANVPAKKVAAKKAAPAKKAAAKKAAPKKLAQVAAMKIVH